MTAHGVCCARCRSGRDGAFGARGGVKSVRADRDVGAINADIFNDDDVGCDVMRCDALGRRLGGDFFTGMNRYRDADIVE